MALAFLFGFAGGVAVFGGGGPLGGDGFGTGAVVGIVVPEGLDDGFGGGMVFAGVADRFTEFGEFLF